jgi:trigger factor
MVDQEIEALRNQTRQQLSQGSGSFELPREMFEDQAKKRVTLGLLIGEIIKQNEMQVDNDRVKQRIEEFAASYEKPEEVVNYYYSDEKQLAAVQNVVMEDQVVDWVLEQVTITEEQTTFAELTEQG